MKSRWTWNNVYQKLYDRALSLIKKDMSMAFYNEKEHYSLETKALHVNLIASLLQVKDEMLFPKYKESDNMACGQKHSQVRPWPVQKHDIVTLKGRL